MKFKIAEYKKSSLAEYCPYLEIIDERAYTTREQKDFFENALVQCKDGSLMMIFRFIPPVSDNSSRHEENTVATMSKALSTLSSRWTVHFDTSYVKPLNYYITESDNMLPLSQRLEILRANEAKKARCYVREMYISLNYKLMSNKKETSEETDTFEIIYRYLTTFIAHLTTEGFKLQPLRGEQLLSYLHYTLTLEQQAIHTVLEQGTAGLDELLCTVPFDPTSYPLRLGKKYLAILSVDKITQDMTSADYLSDLFSLGIPLRLVMRYKALSVEESEKVVQKKRDAFKSKIYDLGRMILSSVVNENNDSQEPNVQQISNKEECEEALDFLTEGDVAFGFYTGVLIIEGESEKEIKDRVRDVTDIFTSLGLLVKVERLNAFCAFLSSLPGDINNNPREFLISSDNAATFMTLSRLYEGERHNNFLESISGVGTPLLYGYTYDGAPYYFNLNAGDDDVGHSLVVGATGSGKSFLLSLMASSWTKYPASRVIIFDKGLSAYPLVKGNGGRIVIPGKDKTCFNPLKHPSTREAECMNFLNALLNENGITSLSAEDKNDISQALHSLFEVDNDSVNLSTYQRILRGYNHNHPLVYILDKYTTGSYGDLFNNTHNNFITSSTERMTLIELGTLMNMGKDVVNPALVFMFDTLSDILADKLPTLLILDECWLLLMNELFRDYIISLLKTMRKNNVFVVLSTQEIEDLKVSESAMKTILSQVHTRIYLADKRAVKDEAISDNYTRLGLSNYQKELLSAMSRKRHYYIISDEGESVVDFRAESFVPYFTLTQEMLKGDDE